MAFLNTQKILLFLYSVLLASNGFSQDNQPDSLLALLKNVKADHFKKVNLLNQVSTAYFNTSPDSALQYATQAKQKACRNKRIRTGIKNLRPEKYRHILFCKGRLFTNTYLLGAIAQRI